MKTIAVNEENLPTTSIEIETSKSEETVEEELKKAGYVEVETVKYTPGSSWDQPSLFPVQSKWELLDGTMVQYEPKPMKRVFNETLQAWIVENPQDHFNRDDLNQLRIVRNNTDQIKNISTIFDTLATKLGIAADTPAKLPPFKPLAHNKPRNKTATNNEKKHGPSATASTTPTTTTISAENSLPILLNPSTENFYSSSSIENVFGEAEIEEIDPTHYEQMLLLEKVSSALQIPTTKIPSLVTLMPVKSNSGIRRRDDTINDKIPLFSGRGFNSNHKQLEETSFVVRTNINVST